MRGGMLYVIPARETAKKLITGHNSFIEMLILLEKYKKGKSIQMNK